MSATSRDTVHVHQSPRGGWEVSLSDRHPCTHLETLEDARRVAYLWAARRHPCELIVHDAYHRVLEHELVEGVGHSGEAAG